MISDRLMNLILTENASLFVTQSRSHKSIMSLKLVRVGHSKETAASNIFWNSGLRYSTRSMPFYLGMT